MPPCLSCKSFYLFGSFDVTHASHYLIQVTFQKCRDGYKGWEEDKKGVQCRAVAQSELGRQIVPKSVSVYVMDRPVAPVA
jgi:hypothetical protein